MRQNDESLLIGSSGSMQHLMDQIELVGPSDAKVLITGESGVGKELVAHAVHSRSGRRQRPFVTVNCAGLAETLLESELFGHTKGSFTGAYRDKQGQLELADTGTVFLDEIGEMSLRMQAVLLRFLETGEMHKVGAVRASQVVDVRVIAATNRTLEHLVEQGTFREDLYYRLNVIHLHVPPLRERREDILILAQRFLEGHPAGVAKSISPEASAALAKHDWPGNVRELENVIERLAVTCQRAVITPAELPVDIRLRCPDFSFEHERRRTLSDELYHKLTREKASFWTAVYPLYMQREITRTHVRDLVRKGLEGAQGNYKALTQLFNMDVGDYKRFLSFLRKHDCRPSVSGIRPNGESATT